MAFRHLVGNGHFGPGGVGEAASGPKGAAHLAAGCLRHLRSRYWQSRPSLASPGCRATLGYL
eukprot:scaffold138304_cov41-Prasinocladus_malaysianus.AAC.1